MTPGDFVVANVEARYHRPIPARRAWSPRLAWARVGNASFTIEAQLGADGRVFASSLAVLVGFDAWPRSRRGRSRESERELARLGDGLISSAS